MAIPAGFEPATHGVEIRYSDCHLTAKASDSIIWSPVRALSATSAAPCQIDGGK
jgi:hypothetical protein